MKVEYDPVRDLLYVTFGSSDKKVAQTVTVSPGVYADMDAKGRLFGLEVLDASEVLGGKLQFQLELAAVAPGRETSNG